MYDLSDLSSVGTQTASVTTQPSQKTYLLRLVDKICAVFQYDASGVSSGKVVCYSRHQANTIQVWGTPVTHSGFVLHSIGESDDSTFIVVWRRPGYATLDMLSFMRYGMNTTHITFEEVGLIEDKQNTLSVASAHYFNGLWTMVAHGNGSYTMGGYAYNFNLDTTFVLQFNRTSNQWNTPFSFFMLNGTLPNQTQPKMQTLDNRVILLTHYSSATTNRDYFPTGGPPVALISLVNDRVPQSKRVIIDYSFSDFTFQRNHVYMLERDVTLSGGTSLLSCGTKIHARKSKVVSFTINTKLMMECSEEVYPRVQLEIT